MIQRFLGAVFSFGAMVKILPKIILILLFVGCVHHHGGRETVWLSGINLIEPWTLADVQDVLAHHPRIVRFPCRKAQQAKIFQACDMLIKAEVLPIIVFDGADDECDYRKRLDVYMARFGARICYEILNEPLAMNGSPGYFYFTGPDDVLKFMNRYIDYIHGHIGKTSVLSCGIANVFDNVELALLKKVVADGHQDILSIHVYSCGNFTNLPEIKKWKGQIIVTEIGTDGDKESFYSDCCPRVFRSLSPSGMIWFDYDSKDFGIKESSLWEKLF